MEATNALELDHPPLLADGQQLVLEGEKGALQPEFVERARQHKPELLLMVIIQQACTGLDITPDQFLALISQDDRDHILTGDIPMKCLRAYAKNFAKGIQSGRILFHPKSGALVRHGLA
ncbi:MAG: hypothetical protein V3U60_11670 [Gammaproteobacteria bacterium]